MSNSPAAFHIGSVPFVNARPLIRYLDLTRSPKMDLTLEIPTRLTEMMSKGLLDAALLPSIEYFRSGDYEIIPEISISADGIVKSVCIFSKVPIENIGRLALDASSRTSVALTKILLKEMLGSLPKLTNCPPTAALGDLDADAMLLIGDSAMAFQREEATIVLDLGEQWKKLTGLPFVYAMWVVQKNAAVEQLKTQLIAARDSGMSKLPDIAAEAATDTGLDYGQCLDYLKNVMRYGLGRPEIEALKQFQHLAAKHGLCEGGVEIVFAD
jgi:chorismate dehydratase